MVTITYFSAILIHTSVKLVTHLAVVHLKQQAILIHTSVKLVTRSGGTSHGNAVILIHTSVKLVTRQNQYWRVKYEDFNPHEREARDQWIEAKAAETEIF